jgi:hypothetical protein
LPDAGSRTAEGVPCSMTLCINLQVLVHSTTAYLMYTAHVHSHQYASASVSPGDTDSLMLPGQFSNQTCAVLMLPVDIWFQVSNRAAGVGRCLMRQVDRANWGMHCALHAMTLRNVSLQGRQAVLEQGPSHDSIWQGDTCL